jgi:CheY-like chemotaxis protein
MAARILIIEDNAANLELMRYLLAAFGHDPIVATDGERGVRLALSERPDVILCDVQMPGVDGYEVLRRLRSQPALAKVPLIAVTALAMVGDREKALGAGFDGYIAKPIDPTAFVAQVEEFMAPHLRNHTTPPAQAAPAEAEVPTQSGDLTILVVDNVPVNLEFARSLLQAAGYRVIACDDGTRALQLAREAAPDLILSDVRMPFGGGYDLIRAVKADASLARIPFIFVTSTFTNESDRRAGLALGATRFLFRPIEPDELLREIAQCLAQQRG